MGLLWFAEQQEIESPIAHSLILHITQLSFFSKLSLSNDTELISKTKGVIPIAITFQSQVLSAASEQEPMVPIRATKKD